MALEQALEMLNRPGRAYAAATAVVRRMLNQAIFEQLLIEDEEVIGARTTALVAAIEAVARPAAEKVWAGDPVFGRAAGRLLE